MMPPSKKLFVKFVPSGDDCRSRHEHCRQRHLLTRQTGYLVTGDKGHLLVLKRVGDIPIVSASDFLRFLGLPENAT